MTNDEPISFIDYWDGVDAALKRLFGIDTGDAGIGAGLIADAQDAGWSPEDFALWLGKKYDLTLLSEFGGLVMTDTLDNDFGMKCPECGASDEIDVAATVWVRLCPDGTDIFAAANGDHEWTDHSGAQCCACGHYGNVATFSKAGGQP